MDVVQVVPEAETRARPRCWAAAIDVPPVPAAGSPADTAAPTVAAFVSVGSALIRMSACSSPSRTRRASSSSAARAAALTSASVPACTTAGRPSTSPHRRAGVASSAPSIEASAATNCTAPSSQPAASIWRRTSPSSRAGSSPPWLRRLPPLEPRTAMDVVARSWDMGASLGGRGRGDVRSVAGSASTPAHRPATRYRCWAPHSIIRSASSRGTSYCAPQAVQSEW